MDKNLKEKYQNELNQLEDLFPKFQSLVTEYALDHSGSQTHKALESALTALRDRSKELKERLGQR